MSFTIQDLGSIGELIGALAVLVTLAYLALQTRQAARGAAAQAPQWISDGFKSWFHSLRTDPELTRITRVALHDWEALSFNDQSRVHALHAEMIVHLEAVLGLSEQHFVDSELAKAWVDNALGMIITPGGRHWWESTKFLYGPRVRGAIEGRLAAPSSLPPPWTIVPFWNLQDEDLVATEASRNSA